MRKVALIAGEASGDALGAWYIERSQHADYIGTTGPLMKQKGVKTLYSIDQLNVVGVVEIIKHVPRLLGMMRMLVDQLAQEAVGEVVLIDFPGFNLRLAKMIKKQLPDVTITYLSPPQLWVWGSWRVKKIKRFVDNVIVLYPFEVAWYKQRGVNARFIGAPVLERHQERIAIEHSKDQTRRVTNMLYDVVLLPGSRRQELSLLPTFIQSIERASNLPLSVAIVVAPTLAAHQIKEIIDNVKSTDRIVYTYLPSSRLADALSNGVCALTKPGTNTLELGLFGVPGVVAYKTSFLTYWLARMVVNVTSMTLPNLLTGKQLYAEHIQQEFTPEIIGNALKQILDLYAHNRGAYFAQSDAIKAAVLNALTLEAPQVGINKKDKKNISSI